jgi:uncharacterized LabA/DUF88 family protein
MNKLSSSSRDSSVAIYWDWQNTKATEMQIQCLIIFACMKGIVTLKKVYSDWNWEKDRKRQKKLRCDGFQLISVPSEKSQPSLTDQELIQDCREQVIDQENIKTVIVISKDKDFTELVKDLQNHGKRVIVISQCKEQTSRKLMKAADGFYTFNQIEQWFSRLPLTA